MGWERWRLLLGSRGCSFQCQSISSLQRAKPEWLINMKSFWLKILSIHVFSLGGSLSFHGPLLHIPFHYIHEYESLRLLWFNVLANQTNGATTEMSWSGAPWVGFMALTRYLSIHRHVIHCTATIGNELWAFYWSFHNGSPGECQWEASSVPKGKNPISKF